jgi:hypothetical protein
MPEENGNGKNGKRVGLLERVKAGVKEDVQSFKTDMPAKAKGADRGSEGSDQDPGLHFDLPPQA